MSLRGAWLILFSAVLTASANLLMRAGVLASGAFKVSFLPFLPQALALARQPKFVTGAVLYALAAVVWFAVMAVEDLSTSYPLVVSMVFILVTAGAAVFFHERVSMQKIAGLLVILMGILLVARS